MDQELSYLHGSVKETLFGLWTSAEGPPSIHAGVTCAHTFNNTGHLHVEKVRRQTLLLRRIKHCRGNLKASGQLPFLVVPP